MMTLFSLLWKLVRMGIVGAGGVVVNEFVLISSLRFGTIVALGLAIELSTLFNFFMNDVWTFRSERTGSLRVRLVRYHASTAVGNAVQFLFVLAFASAFASHGFILIINALGILAGFIVRSTLSLLWVWI